MSLKISFAYHLYNTLSTYPNGMLEENIKHIYDVAHEILISEGKSICKHSKDDTLLFLQTFPDSDNKIKICSNDYVSDLEAHNDYLKNMTGDYLWFMMPDEFYHKNDIKKIENYLLNNKDIYKVDFYSNLFFGSWHYCFNENQKKWANNICYSRIFKYEKDCQWLYNDPLIMSDKNGYLPYGKMLERDETLLMGIKINAYKYITKQQVNLRDRIYKTSKFTKIWDLCQYEKNILFQGDKLNFFEDLHPEGIHELIWGKYK
jgi:hypothetical protein